MAKPTNTIGDRDYGRKMYQSDEPYTEQRKLASNTHADRVNKNMQHSAFKKPYLKDQSYPEMEGLDFPPIDPPIIPKIDPPDDPVDPGGPVTPRPRPKKKEECVFSKMPEKPATLSPGDRVFGSVYIPTTALIQDAKIYGPGSFIDANIPAYNKFAGDRYMHDPDDPNSPQVNVFNVGFQVPDDPSVFDRVTPYFNIPPDFEGPYPLVIEVVCEDGTICTQEILVNPCKEDATLPVYDTAGSSETVDGSAPVQLVAGSGQPPFKWSISGSGFSMQRRKTSGRENVVIASAFACGPATITVTDSCKKTTTGIIRSVNGHWEEIAYTSCPPGFAGTRGGTIGKYMLFFNFGVAGWITTWPCEDTPPCDWLCGTPGYGDWAYAHEFSCIVPPPGDEWMAQLCTSIYCLTRCGAVFYIGHGDAAGDISLGQPPVMAEWSCP